MRKTILFIGIMLGCLMLTTIFPVQSVLAADKDKLVPMELNGTEWAIEFTVVNKKGEKSLEEDVLIFKDKKFISQGYEKMKYTPTNYSLSVSEEDVTSFGTMQIKDKETSFWKGEIRGEKINGSVHVQRPSGGNTTRYYKGELLTGDLKRKSKAKPVVRKPIVPKPIVQVIPPAVKKEPVKPVVEEAEKAEKSTKEAQPVESK